MNEQRSNGTVCVQVLGKQRGVTHMRTGHYCLHTCRAGGLARDRAGAPPRLWKQRLEGRREPAVAAWAPRKADAVAAWAPRKQRLRWHSCEMFTRERPCEQTLGRAGQEVGPAKREGGL